MNNRTVHIIPAHITSLLFEEGEIGRAIGSNWNVTMTNGDVFMLSEKKYNDLLNILDHDRIHMLSEEDQYAGIMRLHTPVRVK